MGVGVVEQVAAAAAEALRRGRRPDVDSCWTNGSLLLKRPNEISWLESRTTDDPVGVRQLARRHDRPARSRRRAQIVVTAGAALRVPVAAEDLRQLEAEDREQDDRADGDEDLLAPDPLARPAHLTDCAAHAPAAVAPRARPGSAASSRSQGVVGVGGRCRRGGAGRDRRRRAVAEDVGGDGQRGLDLRELAAPWLKVIESTEKRRPVAFRTPVVDADEVPEAVEEVGQVVEAALEGEVDGDLLVGAVRDGIVRRDRLETSHRSRAATRLSWSMHARDVAGVRHRARELEEVGDADRRRLGRRLRRPGRPRSGRACRRSAASGSRRRERLGEITRNQPATSATQDPGDDQGDLGVGSAACSSRLLGPDVGLDRERDDRLAVDESTACSRRASRPGARGRPQAAEQARDALLRVRVAGDVQRPRGRARGRAAGVAAVVVVVVVVVVVSCVRGRAPAQPGRPATVGGVSGRLSGQRRQPDVARQHGGDLAQDAIPDEAALQGGADRGDSQAPLGGERRVLPAAAGAGIGSAASSSCSACSVARLLFTLELASRKPAASSPATTNGATSASCATTPGALAGAASARAGGG